PRTEERAAERSERCARARVRETGDGQTLHPLEVPDRGHGLGPGDRVDRAAVEALRAQRHLQSRGLRVATARSQPNGCGDHGGDENESGENDARAHGVPDYAPRAANPPGRAAYLPTKRGARFSAKAARPSFASSVPNRSPNSSASRSSAPGERLSSRFATP